MTIRLTILVATLIMLFHWKTEAQEMNISSLKPHQIISASDKNIDAQFGFEISSTNSLLFVGAPGSSTKIDSVGSGAVYVYKQRDGYWKYLQKLTPPNSSIGTNHAFGIEIYATDTSLIIADPKFKTKEGIYSGSVYQYTLIGDDSFALRQTIIAPANEKMVRGFGSELTVCASSLIISAPFSNDLKGVVFIYDNIDGSYTLNQTLWGLYENGQFGHNVESDGINLAICADKYDVTSIYTYQKKNSGFIYTGTLAPNDGQTKGFGNDVSIDEGIVAVSSYRIIEFFNLSNLNDQFRPFTSVDGVSKSNSIFLLDSILVVGLFDDPLDATDKSASAGRVLVYKKNITGWKLANRIVHPNPSDNSKFGYFIDMNSNSLFITCRRCDVDGVKDAGEVLIYPIDY